MSKSYRYASDHTDMVTTGDSLAEPLACSTCTSNEQIKMHGMQRIMVHRLLPSTLRYIRVDDYSQWYEGRCRGQGVTPPLPPPQKWLGHNAWKR